MARNSITKVAASLLFLILLAACAQNTPSALMPAPTPTPSFTPIPSPTQTATSTVTSSPTLSVTPTPPPPTATPSPTAIPITIAFAPGLPENYAAPLRAALSTSNTARPLQLVEQFETADVKLGLSPLSTVQNPLAERYYAVVAPFATTTDNISLKELRDRWTAVTTDTLFVTTESVADLRVVLGEPGISVVQTTDELLARLTNVPGALGLLPFDQLAPRFKVLMVDSVNVLSNQFEADSYPLAVALTAEGPDAALLTPYLRGVVQPVTNRDANRLTTLIMTGVTAMSRGTAEKMEQKGYTYPAAVISATLRAADITHVSNEVPFIEGCEVKNTVNNLVLCSDYPYWAALEALGTDVVGLSGNHVNDFGRDGARESIKFYRDRNIPLYGSGLNIKEACAPLRWEHNGNRFAFIATLAWWPQTAWATTTEPGACYFYDNYDAIAATITELSQQVDIVSVELQYYETYEPFPTIEQVKEFRALRAAGADIVTGVQSHVPQALEPYGADDPLGSGVIVYGLGNLFFDQMWSWETRTELFVRHAIYQGRLISTEILTAVLEDYAQPRWATPEERVEILTRVFNAAPGLPDSAWGVRFSR